MARRGWFPSRYAVINLNDPRQRRRLRFFLIGGAIELLVLALVGFRGVVYMDTPSFCGQVCHEVMEPQYTVYQKSPHARVDCVKCHIGPGATWLVKSKINGMPQVAATLLNTYHRPIPTPVENLRPARETCEVCHWPARFAGDLLRNRHRYMSDENNTEQVSRVVFKVGGGEAKTARDIHWHIAAKVWYLPLDKSRQEIGWAGVEKEDSTLTEYIDPQKSAEVTPLRMAQEKRLMDCIDCHNRATHVFRSPEDWVNEALFLGKIDRSLPLIKKKAMEILNSDSAPSTIVAELGKLDTFYRQSYPELYAQKKPAIETAIAELQEIAGHIKFPYMRVDWKTYPNNIGHTSSPGCLRCHGKLVKKSGQGEGKPMEATCGICHYSLPAQ